MIWSITAVMTISFFLIVHSENSKWQKIINEVNSANGGWVAGLNFDLNTSANSIKRLMGTILEENENKRNLIHSFIDSIADEDIPNEFHAKDKWPNCASVIQHIRDQGPCGSCWAVAAASTFTDRLCIASQSSNQESEIIAAEDILSCSLFGGCYGGYLRIAWWHIKWGGAVTGGDFKSQVGCKPYSIQPCEHHSSGPRINCSEISASTPKCTSHCTNGDYSVPLKKDKRYVKDYFTVSGEKMMQKAILAGGPLETGFMVFEDFITYKSGVYRYTTGKFLGGHAVKILGWGEENGVPYWLCANSWNSDWGDSGFFKILRGQNECRFESSAFGGIF